MGARCRVKRKMEVIPVRVQKWNMCLDERRYRRVVGNSLGRYDVL